MTRDDAVDCATCLIEEILSCYYLLANLPSLNPSPTVNGLFEKLVHLCSQTLDEATSAKVCPRSSHIFLPLLPVATLIHHRFCRTQKLLRSLRIYAVCVLRVNSCWRQTGQAKYYAMRIKEKVRWAF